MLQRYSREIGAELGIVCRNSDVKFYAYELGIPVFSTVHKAQTARWRKVRRGRRPFPGRREIDPILDGEEPALLEKLEEMREQTRVQKPAWLTEPSYRLGLFSAGVLAVLAIVSVLLPSAEITLYPATLTQTTAFTMQASPSDSSENPAGEVNSFDLTVIVEGRADRETSGQIEIPAIPANGSVKFTNLTDQLVNVPIGTVVRTLDPEPARFATTVAGRLLPGPDQTINLAVEALTRGAVGNRPPNTLRGIEGPLGLQLAVTNPLPTLGGTDTVAPAPTPRDRNQIYDALLTSLQETAAEELAALVGTGDQILAPEPILVQVLEEVYDPPDLQPADRLNLLLRLEFSVPVAPGDEIQSFVTAVLDRNIAAGYRALPDTLVVRPEEDPVILPDGEARWELSASRELVAQLTANQAINLSLGLAPASAEVRIMENMDLADPPRIILSPVWWPRLPILPFRIQIEKSLSEAPGNLSYLITKWD